MIRFTEKTVGVWFVELGDSDFLASVYRDDAGLITLTYRFRHYRDDKAFDSRDEKNWYEAKAKDGSVKGEGLVETTRALAKSLAAMSGGECWELMMADCDGLDDFMGQFTSAPFVETEEAPPKKEQH